MSDEPRLPLTPDEVKAMAEMIVDLRADLAQARAEAAVMVGALGVAEWPIQDAVMQSDGRLMPEYRCATCGMIQPKGHRWNCAVRYALTSDLAAQGGLLLAVVEAMRTLKALRTRLSDELGLYGERKKAVLWQEGIAEFAMWDTLAALDNRKEPDDEQEESSEEESHEAGEEEGRGEA